MGTLNQSILTESVLIVRHETGCLLSTNLSCNGEVRMFKGEGNFETEDHVCLAKWDPLTNSEFRGELGRLWEAPRGDEPWSGPWKMGRVQRQRAFQVRKGSSQSRSRGQEAAGAQGLPRRMMEKPGEGERNALGYMWGACGTWYLVRKWSWRRSKTGLGPWRKVVMLHEGHASK